jgi:hypothetical protein
VLAAVVFTAVAFTGVAVWFCVVCVAQATMVVAITSAQMSLAPKARRACDVLLLEALSDFSFSFGNMLFLQGSRG